MRMIAAEITREKLTLRLHEEIPYQLTVETEKWEDRKDGSTRIDQLIYVMREGHKGIVLGNKGETVKSVGQAARADMMEFLGRPVHLFFGMRHPDSDFIYGDDLTDWQAEGRLTQLSTAVSRGASAHSGANRRNSPGCGVMMWRAPKRSLRPQAAIQLIASASMSSGRIRPAATSSASLAATRAISSREP